MNWYSGDLPLVSLFAALFWSEGADTSLKAGTEAIAENFRE